MADVSKIAANGIEYDVADTTSREADTVANAKISALEDTMAYDTAAANGTIYFTVPNYEVGFIVTSGASTNARGIIIYYCNGQRTVSVTKAFDATGVQITTSDNQIALKNNTSTYLFAMQFKR